MRLITHNVYWFQGYPSHWGAERISAAPPVFDALAHLYAAAQVDILCLQEVHDAELAERLARQLGMTGWIHAPGGIRSDYGGVILSRFPAHFRDLTRDGAAPPHERVHLRASIDREGDRYEVAVVHLPSDRFQGASGNAARVAELRRVVDTSPRPDIVVGDMNSQPNSLPYQFMLEAGYVDAAVAQGLAVERSRWSRGTIVPAKYSNIDYIWIDQAQAHRLTAFTPLDTDLFQCQTPDGHPGHLSDHPPLLMAWA